MMIEERILKAIEEVRDYSLLIENEFTYIQVENPSENQAEEPFFIQKIPMQKSELKQLIEKELFIRSNQFSLQGA